MNRDKHNIFMHHALMESRKAIPFSSPNPHVGAVIVKNDKIIGRGHTQRPGMAHAEVMAVQNAGAGACGSSLYVTLEPCCHFGRTSPCTDLLIKKKIKEVYIGLPDPHRVVCGKGIIKLKKNGIKVKTGLLKEEIENDLQWYIKYIKKNIPYITLKAGISLDGKITDHRNNSKWITSEAVRSYSRQFRAAHDGIIAGINTILEDDPSLTCGEAGRKKQLFYRIILDTNLRIRPGARVLKPKANHLTIIAAGNKKTKDKKVKLIRDRGAEILFCKTRNNRVDPGDLLAKLGSMHITRLIIEGGSEVNYSFLNQNKVDKINLFIAPKLIGGVKSKGWIGGQGFLLNQYKKVEKGKFYNILSGSYMFEGYIHYYVHRDH